MIYQFMNLNIYGEHNIHLVKKTTLSVEKKPLALFLPFLGSISLETSTKLNKPLKNIPKCCKMQIVF